jgi:outer membrane protein assembly factor BamB
VTSDGYIHEQIMATGLDYAPPVKFVPAPTGSSFGLNMNDKVVYTLSGSGCHNAANAVWSIDLNTPDYSVSSYKTQKIDVAGLSGPAIGTDGTAYVFTGRGQAAPPVYANSLLALTAKELKVKDWYTPSASDKTLNASPVVFAYKDKELIVAPGKDGSLVLLDSESLGGPDHHTPLAQTDKLSKGAKRGAWESLATWQDKAGAPWVLASIAGPVEPDAKFPATNGPAPHGSIVAFKVEEKDGKMSLSPAWISRDLINPAPPAIANGVVFALEGGNAHATLYALDAETGKQLYSSGDAIATSSHLAGMSIGDGHVFFTTHDNTLYSFGIPLEH